jgi:hypothetical protein
MIERRRNDLRFVLRLHAIDNLLPIASAAAWQVWTGGRAACGPRPEHLSGTRDKVAGTFLDHRDLEQIAGRRVGHHHGLAVESSDSERPESHRGYLDLCHRYASGRCVHSILADKPRKYRRRVAPLVL